MPSKKSNGETAKILVEKAFPHFQVADSVPANTAPTVRKGPSRAVVGAKVQGTDFVRPLKKSTAKSFVVRPTKSPAADSGITSKSVIADGKRIIAIQG